MATKVIFWDFDGVILDSMNVRDYGFKRIFRDYGKIEVTNLIEYHRYNGGLSRYVKIRYFFEQILERSTTDEEVIDYATQFSKIMKEALVDPKNLIQDSLKFIQNNYKKYRFHIVSGSDQEELRFLCDELKLSSYFLSIHGSPTAKNKLVKDLLNKHKYERKNCCLIGDSINDFDAAKANDIGFYGYNNLDLKALSKNYILDLENFEPQ